MHVLIIGQSLAGTLLAYHMLKAGQTVTVVDDQKRQSSSWVAGGILDPFSGQKFRSPIFREQVYPFAFSTYKTLERHCESSFFHPMPLTRFFYDESEIEDFDIASRLDRHQPYIQKKFHPSSVEGPFSNNLGGMVENGAALLNIPRFLTAMTSVLSSSCTLINDRFRMEDFQVNDNHVQWKSVRADRVVFCLGYQCQSLPFFPHLPWRPSKGEILTFTCNKLSKNNIYINRHWLCPSGKTGFKFGSTYNDFDGDFLPKKTEYNWLVSALSAWLQLPFEITGVLSGVRPVVLGSKPVLGSCDDHPRISILSGFGSKGVLYAPYFSKLLVDHLLHGADIPKAIHLCRFNRQNVQ